MVAGWRGMGRIDSSGANWNFEIKGCLKLSPSCSLFSQNVVLSFLRVSLSHQGRILPLSLWLSLSLSLSLFGEECRP